MFDLSYFSAASLLRRGGPRATSNKRERIGKEFPVAVDELEIKMGEMQHISIRSLERYALDSAIPSYIWPNRGLDATTSSTSFDSEGCSAPFRLILYDLQIFLSFHVKTQAVFTWLVLA